MKISPKPLFKELKVEVFLKLGIKKVKMESVFKCKGIAPCSSQEDKDGGFLWYNTQLTRAPNSQEHPTHKSSHLTWAWNLQEHPTHKSLQWMQQRMPRTYEMIMETLQIYAWPKYCNMYCIPQSLDIHDKDIGINLVICILSNNKIAMMKDVNNSNVRYS